MKEYLAVTKALSDEARVRALVSLADGELCLCQIVTLLRLSPATVSKHMSILHSAGLVDRRKDGRWHYYRLAGRGAPPVVRSALRWTLAALKEDRTIATDVRTLRCVRKTDRTELASCYAAG